MLYLGTVFVNSVDSLCYSSLLYPFQFSICSVNYSQQNVNTLNYYCQFFSLYSVSFISFRSGYFETILLCTYTSLLLFLMKFTFLFLVIVFILKSRSLLVIQLFQISYDSCFDSISILFLSFYSLSTCTFISKMSFFLCICIVGSFFFFLQKCNPKISAFKVEGLDHLSDYRYNQF